MVSFQKYCLSMVVQIKQTSTVFRTAHVYENMVNWQYKLYIVCGTTIQLLTNNRIYNDDGSKLGLQKTQTETTKLQRKTDEETPGTASIHTGLTNEANATSKKANKCRHVALFLLFL